MEDHLGATIAGVAVSESEQTIQTSTDPFTEQNPFSRKARSPM